MSEDKSEMSGDKIILSPDKMNLTRKNGTFQASEGFQTRGQVIETEVKKAHYQRTMLTNREVGNSEAQPTAQDSTRSFIY